MDELAVGAPGQGFRTEKIPVQTDLKALGQHVQTARGKQEPLLVFYPPDRQGDEKARRILTNRVTVQLAPDADARSLAAKLGAEIVAEPSYAPGFFIFETTGGLGASLQLAQALRAHEAVLLAEPMFARQRNKRALPNDPLFPRQWHLQNTGQTGGTAGMDINVVNVWGAYRGNGVMVSVVDDGVAYEHPDLAANTDASLGYDYAEGTADPGPAADPESEEGGDSHGTAVAGIIAAVGNDIGVTGVSPEATIIPIRLLAAGITDLEEAAALDHRIDIVQVSNNSWGTSDDGQTKGGAGPLVRQALQNGTTIGRDGKGTIFVWAGGNGGGESDNSNYDTYANSMHTIAVGALNDLGQKADYSERGANLVVSAPAGLEDFGRQPGTVTTDLPGDLGYNRADVEGDLDDTDYTSTFNGTSAAAPVVSGVVALLLEANPNLGWRDVQEILMVSATQQDPLDPEWIINGFDLSFHHNYGSGLVNAEGAVALGETWTNLPPRTSVSLSENVTVEIPDNDAGGIGRSFDFSATNLRSEHVVVTASITHSYRGDLQIFLISPHGTVSHLAEPHFDDNDDYDGFSFMSTFHWGEVSTGEWQVFIADTGFGDEGELSALKVEIFGTAPVLPQLELVGTSGEDLTLIVDGHAGRLNVVETSVDLLEWFPLQDIYWLNGPYEVELPLPTTNRFYRVQIP